MPQIPMHVTRLRLTNFRNYRLLELEPPPGLVLLVGENAQGKTNLLEAMFYLSTSRSPRTTRDAELVAWQVPEGDQRVARAEATVMRAHGRITLDVTVMAKADARPSPPSPDDDAGDFVAAAPGAQKRIRVNGVPKRAMDLLGNFPVALFRPEDVELVTAAPAVRRRSVDILISQLEPRYPRALQRYARAVTQRNHLLKQMQDHNVGHEQLAPWDDLLVRDGVYIIAERLRALARLSPLAAEAHEAISGSRDRLTMQYRPTAAAPDPSQDAAALDAAFREALAAALRRDVAMGQTTVGPHRDDVALLINGAPAGDYGSRGQQRTAALGWRLAEAAYLREVSHEPPVVLLDDVLSELDALRREAVLEAMAPFDQVFLTTTGAELSGTAMRPAVVFTIHRGALVV